jgi:hypothetical protein
MISIKSGGRREGAKSGSKAFGKYFLVSLWQKVTPANHHHGGVTRAE